MSAHDDFESEPVPGLPERLPPGERVLWRGAPGWHSLARHAFHVRKVAAYFVLLAGWSLVEAWYDGTPATTAAIALAQLGGVAAAALGLLAGMAWLTARETIYTITDRRVVLRFGVALRMTLNVPFTIVGSAGLRQYRDGTGDLPLAITGDGRVSYLVLWPNARPWRLRRPEIMLRSLAEPQQVAAILAQALYRQTTEQTPQEAPRAGPAGGRQRAAGSVRYPAQVASS